jgi:hypothetical protein
MRLRQLQVMLDRRHTLHRLRLECRPALVKLLMAIGMCPIPTDPENI